MRSGICLYNSSGQPNIPLRHPEIFPQYASEGRITKSAEEPTSFSAGAGLRRLAQVSVSSTSNKAM